ncbi:MAG: FAD-dependent oxidoreductase [Spirochaetales bacterium]|nr:FAD-dependent oxidoreductase [Spirochaetales bacterium]
MKVVIVGGVAGGASAAARLRRLDEKAEIIIFERSGHISYANCGLPYYVSGVIEDEDSLYLQTPQSFYRRFRIDARVRHEVVSIDKEAKRVKVKRLDDGVLFDECYDYLILSPGSRPIVPSMPGFDRKNVFTMRTSEDAVYLRKWIEENDVRSAAVVGGGFIGLEVAENLRHRNIEVSLVEKSSHVLPSFDSDMAAFIHQEFRENDVKLYLNKAAESYDGHLLSLDSGEKIPAEIVILAIGVMPDSSLAKEAGLDLGAKESIRVNDKMQTSNEYIYAVGDAIEVKDIVGGSNTVIPLAGPANKQGRIAADNVAGLDSHYKGSLGTSILKAFTMTAASTGLSERGASQLGLEYDYVILSPVSHASYYPGGKVMTMKVLFEKKTGRLLGAQIAGYDGVDKRIDVIATALRAGIKADKLAELELAYAPPYSSAKDPVNMAGFAISNVLEGLVKQFSYSEIPSLKEAGEFLLDTRTPAEFQRGHVEGFVNIPLDELRERLGELGEPKKLYIMCQSGLRSYLSTRILAQYGFDAYNFKGGYRFYSTVEKDEKRSRETLECGLEL